MAEVKSRYNGSRAAYGVEPAAVALVEHSHFVVRYVGYSHVVLRHLVHLYVVVARQEQLRREGERAQSAFRSSFGYGLEEPSPDGAAVFFQRI